MILWNGFNGATSQNKLKELWQRPFRVCLDWRLVLVMYVYILTVLVLYCCKFTILVYLLSRRNWCLCTLVQWTAEIWMADILHLCTLLPDIIDTLSSNICWITALMFTPKTRGECFKDINCGQMMGQFVGKYHLVSALAFATLLALACWLWGFNLHRQSVLQAPIFGHL